LYVSALHDAGFVTTVAESARTAATRAVGTADTDVIVMDLLPEPDEAWELIEARRAEAETAPVVVFTSLVRPDGANRRKARLFGCAAFVAKPCSLQRLVEVVERVHHGERGLEVVDYVNPSPG